MEDTTPPLNNAFRTGARSAPSPSGSPEGAAGDLLSHLLKIEAEAAALVDAAQAEADRRISEGEKQNRSRYEEQYSQAATALEAAYVGEIEGANAAYKKELEAYQDSLQRIRADNGAFSALMTDLVEGR